MGGMDTGDIIWNVEMEVNLFHAMRGHKPAGVNRHFQMIAIHDKLSSSSRKVTSEDVWAHLATLYDLQALNESEIVPFPNKSGDFDLQEELGDLCQKSFPRTSYMSSPVETPKSASKASKQDSSKSTSGSAKAERSLSQSSSKSDGKSGSSSSRAELKGGHPGSGHKSSSHLSSSNTPEPSPKRGKRTRNVPSATNSPITPSEPPNKRRR